MRRIASLVCSSPSAASSPSSSFCDGDASRRASSDFDSESSRRTVSEKQNRESTEKRKRLESDMDTTESNGDVMTQSDILPASHHHRQNIPLPSSQSLELNMDVAGKASSTKRPADTSPSEITSSDDRVPALPRKKQATSHDQTLQQTQSIHGPEKSGYSIKEFMEYTRIKRRIGLIRQYEEIKAMPPRGTFFASRYTSPSLFTSRLRSTSNNGSISKIFRFIKMTRQALLL